jgi:hypothetical protein
MGLRERVEARKAEREGAVAESAAPEIEFASAAAALQAEELGVDPATITPTGSRGKATMRDVNKAFHALVHEASEGGNADAEATEVAYGDGAMESPEAEAPEPVDNSIKLAPGEYRLPTHGMKIEKVIAKANVPRPVLEHAWLLEWKGAPALQVTDSYKLAIIPLLGELRDEPVAITKDAAKAIGKEGSFVMAKDGSITVLTKQGKQHFDPPKPPIVGTPPAVEGLVPTGEPVIEFGINGQFLRELHEALGGNSAAHVGVKLRVFGTHNAIHVEPLNREAGGAEGLIMPIRLNV